MTYQQTLDYLYSQLPIFQRQGKAAYNKDLGKTIALCSAIGNPEEKLKFIHVAGTNGKGSVCHMLASVLFEAGYKTGLYTSPHLIDFRERIRVNGNYIAKDFVVGFVKEHQNAIETINPSFFELTFAMSLQYFLHCKTDIVVLETGMGGRLDSTNVVKPLLSIITNIGLDHQAYLGNTIKAIAKEKAGIIKEATPALLSDSNPDVISIFSNTCQAQNTKPNYTSNLVSVSQFRPTIISFKERAIELNNPFTAKYQLENMGTVAAAFSLLKTQLNLEDAHLKNGIEGVQRNFTLLGRWQQLNKKPQVICDVGHNEDGIREIILQLKNEQFEQLHIVFGMVNDKDTATLKLLPKQAAYYLCQAQIPRALPIEELNTLMVKNDFKVSYVSKKVEAAYHQAFKSASPNDLILVVGSLFVVAEVLALFDTHRS